MFYMKGGIAVGNESLRTNDSVDEILDTYGRMVYRLAYARTKTGMTLMMSCRRCFCAISVPAKSLPMRSTAGRG